jgi:hypothetical protein
MHCFMHGGEILNLLSSGIDRVCSLVDTVHMMFWRNVLLIFLWQRSVILTVMNF